jgi:hypothetical protein
MKNPPKNPWARAAKPVGTPSDQHLKPQVTAKCEGLTVRNSGLTWFYS